MSQCAAVSLRTASGFLESLRDGREIWLGGERVVDVTAPPLLRGAATTIAGLYALQHRPDLQDRLSLPIVVGPPVLMFTEWSHRIPSRT